MPPEALLVREAVCPLEVEADASVLTNISKRTTPGSRPLLPGYPVDTRSSSLYPNILRGSNLDIIR